MKSQANVKKCDKCKGYVFYKNFARRYNRCKGESYTSDVYTNQYYCDSCDIKLGKQSHYDRHIKQINIK